MDETLNQTEGESFDPNYLSGPIPGMSLTTEPGNRPWENPPSIVTVEEAVKYYSDKILDPSNTDVLIDALEERLAIENIAEALTLSAVMEGIHTIDISILINPVIKELIKYVADVHDIDYVDSYEEEDVEGKLSRPVIKRMVKEAIQSSKKKIPPEVWELQQKLMKQGGGETSPAPQRGLMARPMQTEMEGA